MYIHRSSVKLIAEKRTMNFRSDTRDQNSPRIGSGKVNDSVAVLHLDNNNS